MEAPPPPQEDIDFEIVHLKDAAEIYPQPEFIFAGSDLDTRVALKAFPSSKVFSFYRGNIDHIYEIFMAHLDDLQEVYESLIDEESKKAFCGYWLGCISNQLGKFVFTNSAHYRIAGFFPEQGGIVIEAGACDGGTAAIFSDMGYKVYTFEMDKVNYERTLKVAEEKNFVVENFGLGAYSHEMKYLRSDGFPGSSNLNVNGNETAKVIAIDDYVGEKKLPCVDMIKLDVEGAELDVLKGAVTTIARFKPILALSAYHKLEDFWTLMNFVKSIRPDYEFAMRQCADTVESVPSVYTAEMREAFVSLGLEPEFRNWCECVLLAR